MDHSKDLVTVVIPTYNCAYSLSRAIESVLNQTYQNTELIIVDDCSTDNTEEIVKKLSDSRIQYIRHPENRGVSAARNTGIKNSKGDFIALLDHDDEYLPKKIEKSLKVFKNAPENVGMVWSNLWNVNKEKKEKKIVFLKYRLEDAKKWVFPVPSTWIIRKKVFEKIGFFDEELGPAEDTDFAIRLCKNFSFYFIDEPLVIHHIIKASLGHNIEKSFRAKSLLLEKYIVDLKKNRRLFARCFYSLGRYLLRISQTKEARKYFLKAFIIYPVKVEYFGKFLRTYFKK